MSVDANMGGSEDTLLLGSASQNRGARDSIVDVDTVKFEYVITFPIEKRETCDYIKSRLSEVRLVIEESISRDGDEIFLFITTTFDVFEEIAQRLQLKKPLKRKYGGGKTAFSPKRKAMFEGYRSVVSFWNSYERNQIVYNLIQGSTMMGGANLDIPKLISRGEISQCFPLHNVPQKQRLMQYWVRRSWNRWSQPIDLIREYFGEYITLYFAWLEHYTKWLIFPSIFGTIVFCIGAALQNFDNYTVPFYCIMVMVWATCYLEFWKRKNSELITEWDVRDFVQQERVRPSFKGEERCGTYINGEFIPLDPQEMPNVPKVLWSSSTPRYWKYAFGLSMLTTFLAVVVVATLGIFVFRLFIDNLNSLIGPVIAGVVNAIVIIIFNMIYRKVAVILTDWENHRTESEYENSFIIKNFMFQFVNSYISLFYIAFVKERWPLFNLKDEKYHPKCSPNCMTELTIQLGSILLTNIFIGQANEVLLPWLKGKFSVWIEGEKIKYVKHSGVQTISQAEEESKFWQYESAFDDYNEMAIQFGYVTLFAAAFPLAPLAALINNVVEMRTDALKLLAGQQRPHPRGANSIGNWQDILEIIGYIAVATNCCLVFITSSSIREFFPEDAAFKLWMAVLAEHLLFVLKWLLAQIIPDTPKWVREAAARREYLKQAAEQEFLEGELEKEAKQGEEIQETIT